MRKKILLIEDDLELTNLIKFKFEKENFQFQSIHDCTNITKKVSNFAPSLILLDININEWNGFDICRDIKSKENLQEIPIIFLTAKDDDVNVITGLELGAADYVSKPFSMDVLFARVRKVLRDNSEQSLSKKSRNRTIKDLIIDSDKHQVFLYGNEIDLNHSEFKLLNHITSKPGWVFNRIQLIDAIRGDGYIVTDRIIDVVIVSLRKKLKDYGEFIETIRGVGYRFKLQT